MTQERREEAQRRIRALLELGRVDAACADALRWLAEDPKDPTMLELLGLCQIRLKQRLDAVATLRAACAEGPERAHAHYLRGFASREAGDLPGALDGLREAIRLAPDEPVYLRALA